MAEGIDLTESQLAGSDTISSVNSDGGSDSIAGSDQGGNRLNLEPPKRGRGRPSNAEIAARKAAAGNGPAEIDPRTITGSGGSDTGKSGGTGTTRSRATSQKAAALSVDALVTALSVLQMSLVFATGIPECKLSDDQTETLAKATAKVARHYPSVMTEKQQDFVGLGMAIGSIAFAQGLAYQNRVNKEKGK